MTKTFRTLLFLVVVATVGLGTGPAQKAGLLYVVVVMEGYNIRLQPQINGLRDGLEELKYVEGENLKWQRIEGGTSGGARTNLKSAGRKTMHGRISDPWDHGNQPCKEVAPSIPTVFLPAADPVKSGFVRSLPSPGTNLTGLTFFTDNENLGKQLEVFKQVVPSLDKVGVLFDSRLKSPALSENWKKLTIVGSWLGIRLIELPVTSSAETSARLLCSPTRQ